MIYVVTPTRDRPSIKVTDTFVRRQTVPVRWIVVEDGGEHNLLGMAWHHIRLERMVSNSLRRNLFEGLRQVPGDAEAVVVMEDDDWYGPEWCARIVEPLSRAPIAALHSLMMYHVPSGEYRVKQRPRHLGSLNTTSIRGDTLDAAIAILGRIGDDEQVDTRLWEGLGPGTKIGASSHFVSLKGLPGRPGGAGAHQRTVGTWKRDDVRRTVLRTKLGDDAETYLEMCGVTT